LVQSTAATIWPFIPGAFQSRLGSDLNIQHYGKNGAEKIKNSESRQPATQTDLNGTMLGASDVMSALRGRSEKAL
jgi:hypothetical protein